MALSSHHTTLLHTQGRVPACAPTFYPRMLRLGLTRICHSGVRACRPPVDIRRSPFATRAADTAVAPPSPAVEADLNDKRQSSAYPFTDIEKKWQQYWEENQTFRTPDNVDTTKPKYYVLDMFPYPR